MSDRELIAVVIKHGNVYGPGYINPPPADVAVLITNPLAWSRPLDEQDQAPGVDDEPTTADGTPDVPATEPADLEEEPPVVAVDPEPADEPRPAVLPIATPPRSGKGSGLEKWTAWATQHAEGLAAVGFELTEDTGRDDIIDAGVRAGLIEG